jgi:dihydrofolate reductase
MGKVTANLSVSLDGFYTGPNPGPTQGLGEGGEVLHDWLRGGTADRAQLTSNEIVAEMLGAAGAMIAGRDGYDAAQAAWGPHPPFEVPVLVLTHEPRPDDTREGTTFHFVEGFDPALALAREVAGEKDVALHGASAIRQALAAGVLEELQLQIVPVILGAGLRLFEEGELAPVELELLRVVDAPGAVHLKYRVR